MNAAFERIAILIRKELLVIFKDPRSRLVLFLPIVLQSLLFGYAATFDLNEVPYALLDQDRSGASQDFVSRLDGTTVFKRVSNLTNAQEIADAIGRKRVILVIQIPRDFERRLLSGQGGAIQAITDGRNSNTAGISVGYVSAVVESFNAAWSTRHGAPATPLRVEARAWYNPTLETRWNMIPSLIAALSMLQTLMLTALSVAREREQGTFDQLLVTPLRPSEIMVGKSVPSILIGISQSTLILLVARFWFGIPFQGSLLALYLGLFLFTTASVGIGLALSALALTMQQAMLYAFVLLMPMMLLSGLTTSIKNMPIALQYVTLVNPLRYAIEMVQRVYLEGAGLRLLFNDIWPLIAIACVTLPTASWLFRHRLA